MSHPHRFYASFDQEVEGEIPLPPEEAHHAVRVARLKVGDSIAVINGRGDEVRGVLSLSGKRGACITVQERMRHPRRPVELTLALGGLHQEKLQQEVIKRAVEAGFARVCFWQAEHSQKNIAFHEKWIRTAIETCKQCGRPYVPEITIASSLEQFLREFDGPGLIGLIDAVAAAAVQVADKKRLAVVIGPEGDFSPRERRAAAAFDLTPVNLGDFIYRSETAAAMLMVLVAHQVGELGPPLAVIRS